MKNYEQLNSMKKILLVILFLTGLLGFFSTTYAADEWCVTAGFKCVIAEPNVICDSSKLETKEKCEAVLKTKEPTKGADGKGALSTQGNIVYLVNPIGGKDKEGEYAGNMNLPNLLGTIIKNTLGILGTAALAVFVYAGFQWVTAAGNSEKVSAGASAMLWSAIGICIIFSSYAILRLIFETLLGPGALSTNPTQPTGPACYCTVDDKPDTPMTDPADGFDNQFKCEQLKEKVVTAPKSGKKIQNCTWK